MRDQMDLEYILKVYNLYLKAILNLLLMISVLKIVKHKVQYLVRAQMCLNVQMFNVYHQTRY